jgi:hypothetical protein
MAMSSRVQAKILFSIPFRHFSKTFLTALSLVIQVSVVVGASAPRHVAPVRIKGSFVIAAICKDGIIVASDSRGTLKDSQGRRIAYYDINQKIFPIDHALIADTGYASLNDPNLSFLSALMFRFGKSPASQVDVSDLPASYFDYAATVLSPAGSDSAKLQTLVFAGYRQKTPVLCIYRGESDRTTKCSFSGYVSSPNQKIVGLGRVSSLSFEQAAKVMQTTIDDYAAAVQPGSVGGPVVIRIITPSTSGWFRTPPDWPDWQSFSDLANDYRHGRVPMQLMPGVKQAQLDALVDEGATWARLGKGTNSEKVGLSAPIIGSNRSDR